MSFVKCSIEGTSRMPSGDYLVRLRKGSGVVLLGSMMIVWLPLMNSGNTFIIVTHAYRISFLFCIVTLYPWTFPLMNIEAVLNFSATVLPTVCAS